MPNQQQGPGDHITLQSTVNGMAFAAVIYSTCFTPFLRRGFGSEALGFQGLFAFIVMLFVAGTNRIGLGYFLLWLVFLAYRRWETTVRRWRGHIVHSQYAGDSLLAVGCSSQFAKRWLEPPLVLTCGAVLSRWSPNVGMFVMWGTGALVIVQLVEYVITQLRIQHMHDGAIEAEYYSGKFRGR